MLCLSLAGQNITYDLVKLSHLLDHILLRRDLGRQLIVVGLEHPAETCLEFPMLDHHNPLDFPHPGQQIR